MLSQDEKERRLFQMRRDVCFRNRFFSAAKARGWWDKDIMLLPQDEWDSLIQEVRNAS